MKFVSIKDIFMNLFLDYGKMIKDENCKEIEINKLIFKFHKLVENELSDWHDIKIIKPKDGVDVLFFVIVDGINYKTVGRYRKEQDLIFLEGFSKYLPIENIICWRYLPSDPEDV